MSRPNLNAGAWVLLVACLLAGCGRGNRIDENASVEPLTVAQLDTFSTPDSLISLSGQVLEQDEDRRWVVLTDGTGLIWVMLPEPLPELTGRRLQVVGRLRRSGKDPLQVRALWWLYDSTGVSVRSSS